MKRPLTVALLMLVALHFGEAAICRSEPLIDSQVKSRGKKRSRTIKLRLGLVGFLPMPAGYKAYYTGRTVDAWGGYILSLDDSLRIEWSAGMVQTPFADGEDKFLWVKRENIEKGRLQYGLKRTDKGEMIVATVGFANFTMLVKREGGVGQFLKLVRSYKVEQCNNDCESPLPAPPSNNGMHPTADTIDFKFLQRLGAAGDAWR
jgi:hypothetical protein